MSSQQSFEKFLEKATKQMVAEKSATTDWLLSLASIFGVSMVVGLLPRALFRAAMALLTPFGLAAGAAIGGVGLAVLGKFLSSTFGEPQKEKSVDFQTKLIKRAEEDYYDIVNSKLPEVKKDRLLADLLSEIMITKK